MDRTEIVKNLTVIFRKVFNDNNLIIRDEMSANDVDAWDSLSHMLMIAEVEKVFGIKFKLRDLNKMKQVGDLISIIESKLA